MTPTPDATRDISSGATHATTGWRSPDELSIDLNDASQRRFGDYELVEKIGQGGMGVVYRARQHTLDRDVALKLLAAGPTASEGFVERFRSEARSAARMQHPNIVEVYEFGHRDGINFFSMRLIEGETLSKRVARAGAMKPREAAALMRTLAEAIDYAHRLGVLHLDLKPANVLLTREGTPLVADFGLARRIDAGHEGEYEISGTPSYMSPEQAQPHAGPPGPPADIYGLGAILYECLLARPPFDGGSMSGTLERVVNDPVKRPRKINRKIPADLEAICLKCLAKEPAQRYATARALADELGRFLEGRPVQARWLSPIGRTWRWMKREPWKATALAAMFSVVGVIGFAAWTTYQVAIGIFDNLLFAGVSSTTGRAFLAEWGFSPQNWDDAIARASWSGRIRRNVLEQSARQDEIGPAAEVIALFASDDTALRQETDQRLRAAPGLEAARNDLLLLVSTREGWSEARLPDAIAALTKAGTDGDGVMLLIEACRGATSAPCDAAGLEARVAANAADNAAAWVSLASRPDLSDPERIRLIERAAKAPHWRAIEDMVFERLPAVYAQTLAISLKSYPLAAEGIVRPQRVADFVAFSTSRGWPMTNVSAQTKPCIKQVQPVGSSLRDTCLALARVEGTARDIASIAMAKEVAFTQATTDTERAALHEWRRDFVWAEDLRWRNIVMMEPSRRDQPGGPGKFLEDFAKGGETQAMRNALLRNRISLSPPPGDKRPPSDAASPKFNLEQGRASPAAK